MTSSSSCNLIKQINEINRGGGGGGGGKGGERNISFKKKPQEKITRVENTAWSRVCLVNA